MAAHRCERCFLRYAAQHWRDAYGATILTKAEYRALDDEAARQAWARWLCGLRQRVETTFNTLTDLLGAKVTRARGLWGLWARFAAKVLAFILMVQLNRLLGRNTCAVFDPIS